MGFLRLTVLMPVFVMASTDMASAHAFLERAKPPVGSRLTAAPSEVRLWFTQALEPAFSTVEVEDESGRRVTEVRANLEQSDPQQLVLPLPPLAPGTYRVRWRVVSVDTHVTQGDYVFH